MSTTATRAQAQRSAAVDRGWVSAGWTALGTSVEIIVTEPHHLQAACTAVTGVLRAVDRAASRFRPDSELSLLNGAAGATRAASPLFVRALRVALDAAAWTDGLVDPTIGAALLSAGYDRTFSLVARHGPAVTWSWQQAPGWQCVTLDETAGTVRLPSGVMLDLGATAKALACDLAVEAAARAVPAGVLLSIGGDVSVAGPVPEGGWPVRLADVADPALAESDDSPVVVLTGGGLATSGTRARRWQRGGTWLHHIIDPRTGGPSTSPWVTVSVLADTCVLANAASTAAVIRGADAPAWLAAQGLSCHLVAGEMA